MLVSAVTSRNRSGPEGTSGCAASRVGDSGGGAEEEHPTVARSNRRRRMGGDPVDGDHFYSISAAPSFHHRGVSNGTEDEGVGSPGCDPPCRLSTSSSLRLNCTYLFSEPHSVASQLTA